MATFSQAKKAGFQGDFNDWVSAGRPNTTLNSVNQTQPQAVVNSDVPTQQLPVPAPGSVGAQAGVKGMAAESVNQLASRAAPSQAELNDRKAKTYQEQLAKGQNYLASLGISGTPQEQQQKINQISDPIERQKALETLNNLGVFESFLSSYQPKDYTPVEEQRKLLDASAADLYNQVRSGESGRSGVVNGKVLSGDALNRAISEGRSQGVGDYLASQVGEKPSQPDLSGLSPEQSAQAQLAYQESLTDWYRQVSKKAQSELGGVSKQVSEFGQQLEQNSAMVNDLIQNLNSQSPGTGDVVQGTFDQLLLEGAQAFITPEKITQIQQLTPGIPIGQIEGQIRQILRGPEEAAAMGAFTGAIGPGQATPSIPEPLSSSKITTPSEPEKLPENVVVNESGSKTYINPDTNKTFDTNQDGNALDLSKFSDEDWKNLDSLQLLQAEIKVGLNQLDDDKKLDDAFFKDTRDLMSKVYDNGFNFTTEMLKAQTEELIIQKMEQEDELFFAERQNELDESEALDEIALAQGKTENYLKGKLSAFGAGKSSAALSIMASNNLKFAKLKTNTKSKYDLEGQKIQRMQLLTQRAFANTIVKLNLQANKDVSDLATTTQGNLLNLMNQKLISDSERESKRINLQLGYIKGVRDIESGKAQAEADAMKESRGWMKDQVQMGSWMEKQTGTIWRLDASGQLVDTGEESEDAKNNRMDMELAWAKLQQSASSSGGGGGGGSGLESEGSIVDYIEAARASGQYTDQEIMNSLSISGPLVGGGEGGAKITRFAERYINTTAQPKYSETQIPFASFVNGMFGFDVPSKRITSSQAPMVVPQEPEDAMGKLTSILSSQTSILEDINKNK